MLVHNCFAFGVMGILLGFVSTVLVLAVLYGLGYLSCVLVLNNDDLTRGKTDAHLLAVAEPTSALLPL